MSKKIIIAIDGPAASGKSSAAKYLAEKLGFTYLDTGAMYRAVTYLVLKNNIQNDTKAIVELVKNLDIRLEFKNGVTNVFVNGEDVTDFIRSPEVSSMVSEVSVIPEVRSELVKLQRKIGENVDIVAEGRDTTTVVFPNADLKVFLTADIDERAKRRFEEYLSKGRKVAFEDVRANLSKRDRIDSSREHSPLSKADDAFELDTTNLTIDEEIQKIIDRVKQIKFVKELNT
ncbi:cytidylate kinase [bacterium BMS3Abin04]|nr:cytidylate kinase [bacterium BMS3Abin04]